MYGLNELFESFLAIYMLEKLLKLFAKCRVELDFRKNIPFDSFDSPLDFSFRVHAGFEDHFKGDCWDPHALASWLLVCGPLGRIRHHVRVIQFVFFCQDFAHGLPCESKGLQPDVLLALLLALFLLLRACRANNALATFALAETISTPCVS